MATARKLTDIAVEDGQPDMTSSRAPASSLGLSVGPFVVRVHDRLKPIEAIWRRLERDPWNSLHQAFDWCDAWVKTHDYPVVVIEASMDGETAFILPLEIEGHFGVRTARFIASSYSNYNSGLFSAALRQRQLDPSLWHQVLRTALAGKADLVSLTKMPLAWRDERHPLSSLRADPNPNSAFQLALGPDMESTIAVLNAKSRRKKYRVQMKRIEEAGGFEHVRARTRGEKQIILDSFFRQKAERFESAGLPDVFRAPETQAFFRLLLDADNGGKDVPLELHAIRMKGPHAGTIAAILGVSRKGDHVICQFGSIDDRLAPEASPGELLFWLTIEESAVSGAKIFDFGIGDQDYKRRWCRTETPHFDILYPVNTLGQLAAFGSRLKSRFKRWVKNHPQLYGIIQRLRSAAG